MGSAQGSIASFGKFASPVMVGVGAAILGVGIASVKAASDLGESLNKAKVVFGSAQDSVISFSETTAKSLGISQAAALESAAGFGAMAQSAGLSEKASASLSVDLVKLAADMASFNNQDPSEMLERLRSGLAGEAEPLRKFGVFISEARVQTEAYASGIAKAGEELTDAQKVQARFNIIMQDTTKQQGDFARTVGTSLPNQLRVLKASLTDAAAEIGRSLLPSLVKLVAFVNDFVVPAFVATAEGIELAFDPETYKDIPAVGEAFNALEVGVQHVGFAMNQTNSEIRRNGLPLLTEMQGTAAAAAAGITNLGDSHMAFSLATQDSTEAVEDNTDAIRENRQAVLAATNSFLGIQVAANDVAEAQREVNRLERLGKEDTKAYDDAVIDLLGSQISLEEAVFSFGQELIDSGKKTSDVVGKIKDMGREFGLSKGEVQELTDRIKEYIRQINNIPKEQTTTVTTIFRQQGDFPIRAGPTPGLQHGGIVERTGLAVVHEGEVFSGINNEMGFGGNVMVEVFLDGERVSGALDRIMTKRLERNGAILNGAVRS